jgi:hypothetical protein
MPPVSDWTMNSLLTVRRGRRIFAICSAFFLFSVG